MTDRNRFATLILSAALAAIGAIQRRIGAELAHATGHHGGAVRPPAARRTPSAACSARDCPRFSASRSIVENVAGGGGMTGTARVAKAAPDGYQFVFASVDSIAIVPTMHKEPLYNSATDLAAGRPRRRAADRPDHAQGPAGQHACRNSSPTLKANQGKMQFGSSGVGSGSHFSCARLNAALGVNPTHVPYRGSGQAMQDLIAGRIDYFCALGAAAMGPLEGGNAKAIALLDQRALAAVSERCRPRKEQGTRRRRLLFLDGVLLSQGHARRHRAEALRGDRQDAELAHDAGAAEESRRHRDRRGSALARLPEERSSAPKCRSGAP